MMKFCMRLGQNSIAGAGTVGGFLAASNWFRNIRRSKMSLLAVVMVPGGK